MVNGIIKTGGRLQAQAQEEGLATEQAQGQLPWCPAPHRFLTCMSVYISSRLPLTLDSLHFSF